VEERPTRTLYYDFWRTLCVTLVVITHADDQYADWNVFGVLHWVLPILSMISGTLYAKSRQPLPVYAARLLAYSSLGSLLNGAAAMLMGIEWHGKVFGDVVLYQNSFVYLFALGAIVAAPLKSQLGPDSEPRTVWASMALYVTTLAALLIAQLLLWHKGVTVFDQEIRVCGEVLVTTLLAAFLTYMLPATRRGLTGWVLLLWIFGTRIAHQEPRPGSDIHYMDLYIFSFYVQKVPLLQQARLGQLMASLWPIWGVGSGLLLKPGTRARLDLMPFDSAALRLRQYLPELAVVLAFTCIPSAGPDATLTFPKATGPHLAWLSWWGLLAFVSHKAVYYVVTPMPWGLAVVLVAMPGVVYGLWRGCRGGLRKRPEDVSQDKSQQQEEQQEEQASDFCI